MNALQTVLAITLIAWCTAATTASEITLDVLIHGPTQPSNAQVSPCILFIRETAYLDGSEGHLWECKVFGPDAQSAGAVAEAKHSMVKVEGIDLVLASNSEVTSGLTTLYAKGAIIADHTLTITSETELFFGEDQPAAERRRRLAKAKGDLSLLVVRVTTNDASLSHTAAGISDNIFGTNGDVVNLKSNVEDCSNNEVTINPATGSGTGCENIPGFGSAFTWNDGASKLDCNMLSSLQIASPLGWCASFGNRLDLDGSGMTANTACCACDGGVSTSYSNPVQDGVLDLSLNVDAENSARTDLENDSLQQLESLFKTDFLGLGLMFDLVMICVPEGSYRETDNTKHWIASSLIGGFLSLCWCLLVRATMLGIETLIDNILIAELDLWNLPC